MTPLQKTWTPSVSNKVMFLFLFKEFNSENLLRNIYDFVNNRRTIFFINNRRSTLSFSLSHSDFWGPLYIPNICRLKWYVFFIDNCTRVTWFFLLKSKSNVNHIFPKFHNMIKTQFNTSIKNLVLIMQTSFSMKHSHLFTNKELSMSHLVSFTTK